MNARILIILCAVTAAVTARGADYSAPGLFNRGNACYRAGKLGEAILNYERARVLAPRDPDIADNLTVARRKAGIEEQSRAWFYGAVGFVSLNELSWLGSLALLLTGAGLVLMRFAPKQSLGPRVLSVAAVTTLTAVMFALFVRWPETRRAIVTVKAAPVYIAPVTVTQSLFTLTEGQPVSIRNTSGDFVLVEAGDGRRGWVSRGEVEPVIPTEG